MSAAKTRRRRAKLTLGAVVAAAVIANARPAEPFSTTGVLSRVAGVDLPEGALAPAISLVAFGAAVSLGLPPGE